MRALRGSRGSHARRARPSRRLAGRFCQEVAQSLCAAGPRRSTQVLEEAGGSILSSPCVAWVHTGPAQEDSIICVAARHFRRGAMRVRSLAPFHQKVAQLCGAGPRGSY